MKSAKHVLLFAVLSFFSSFIYGQTTHNVTLIVDTSNITNGKSASRSCYFEGQSEGDDPETFLTEVKVEDTIIWKGRSVNGNDYIAIKKVFKQRRGSRINIFNTDTLRGTQNVRGTVQRETPGDSLYTYTIHFRINEGSGIYIIDPLIKSKPKD